MTTMPITGPSDDLAREVIELIEEIQGKVQSFQDKVNSVLSYVPGFLEWAIGKILDAWDDFCAKMQEFWTLIQEVLSYIGDPGGLRAAADSWTGLVGSPVSNQVSVADAGRLSVDDNWSGDAAEQYRQTLPLQKAAMGDIQDVFATRLSEALGTMAGALTVFYGAMVAAVVAFAGALAVGIAALVGVVTAPGAIIAVVVGVAALITGVTVGITNLRSGASSTQAAFESILGDNSAYPGGAWPQATV